MLRAIEQLGYRPSHLAAALSRGTPRTVAIVMPHLTRPSSVERLAGALAVLAKYEYDSVVCNVATPAQRDHVLAMLVARHRADGVIVVSLPLGRAQLDAFRAAALPLVAVDVVARGVPHTVINDVAAGRLATEPPAGAGPPPDRLHRRPGAARGVHRAGLHRLRAAAGRLPAGAGRGRASTAMTPWSGSARTGRPAPQALAGELLGLADPPSAIFAASDTQAMGVLAAADQVGAQVPGQLSVIGFDDIQSAALLGLSTVRQPLEDSGAQGARAAVRAAARRAGPAAAAGAGGAGGAAGHDRAARPAAGQPRRPPRPPSAARAAARRPCGRWPTAAAWARAAYRITRAL